MQKKIDPWGSCDVKDYDKAMKEFGIEKLERFPKRNILFDTGFVFGHKNIRAVLKAVQEKKRFAMMTGLMPSGPMHLGHALVVEQMKFFQELGAECYVASADIEAYLTRGLKRDELAKISEDYFLTYIALGLKADKCRFYYQSSGSQEYMNLSKFLAKKITFNEMKAIYGELSPAKIVSALTQVADILHPQLKENGGACPVIVPVGLDQLPHINLTGDLAYRFREEYGFVKISATFQKLLPGLQGGKMSSSQPNSAIFFSDGGDVVRKKIIGAMTGGRKSVEEQKKKGGSPEICPVYAYHLLFNNSSSGKIYEKCKKGELMCGECKKELANVLVKFVGDIQDRKKKAKNELGKYFR